MPKSRQFLRRLFLFMMPVVVALTGLYGTGLYVGDALPVSVVVRLQDVQETVIYGGVDSGMMFDIKVSGANYYRPPLLVLGSSRIHTIGTFVVDNPSDFFNAWQPGLNPDEALPYLRALDTAYSPTVLVWAIDQRFFSPERGLQAPPEMHANLDPQLMLKRSVRAVITLARTVVTRSPLLENIMARTEPSSGFRAIGIDAQRGVNSLLARGAAFIGQSSMDSFYRKSAEQRYQEADRGQFVPGSYVDETKLAVISATLDYAQQHNMQVIAYLPPYSPLGYGEVGANADYQYLSDIAPTVAPVFEAYGFRLFDFTNPSIIGFTDEDFIDGVHLTPRANLRLYLHLLQRAPDLLEQFSSGERLDQLLQSIDDPFLMEYYRSL